VGIRANHAWTIRKGAGGLDRSGSFVGLSPGVIRRRDASGVGLRSDEIWEAGSYFKKLSSSSSVQALL